MTCHKTGYHKLYHLKNPLKKVCHKSKKTVSFGILIMRRLMTQNRKINLCIIGF